MILQKQYKCSSNVLPVLSGRLHEFRTLEAKLRIQDKLQEAELMARMEGSNLVVDDDKHHLQISNCEFMYEDGVHYTFKFSDLHQL